MSFGEYLTQKREEKGISKEDILKLTKVRRIYLDALEDGRFEELPPKAFVVGFLRSISKILETNENELVQKYLVELSEQEDTIKENSLVYKEYQINKKKHVILWAVLLVAIVLIILSPVLLRS